MLLTGYHSAFSLATHKDINHLAPLISKVLTDKNKQIKKERAEIDRNITCTNIAHSLDGGERGA